MTPEEHKARHKKLHRSFDELVADFIKHSEKLPSKVTVLELIMWSYKQTQEPEE
jgi:hypothetical protein